MSNNRQQIRRLLFVIALPTMPVWEVWEEKYAVDYWAVPLEQRTVTRRNFKGVSRRQRRTMARDLTKRQWVVRHHPAAPPTPPHITELDGAMYITPVGE